MKRYVKLFESFSDDQNEFLHKIGKTLGLHDHSDELELILSYAARSLHTVPENINVTQISKEELESITKDSFREGGMLDLKSLGVKSSGIARLSHGEKMTMEQFREISKEIREEHPELYKEDDRIKNQKAFGEWMQLRNKKAQKYGIVLATGPAGIFLLKVKQPD